MKRFTGVMGVAMGLCLMAWVYMGSVAEGWVRGSERTQLPLADAVASHALERGGDAGLETGSPRFDGEWDWVTCQMTILGLTQVIHEHPHTRDRYLPAVDACMDWLITPEARAFGTRAWGADGLAADDEVHAYLGYLGLALGARRSLGDDPRYDDLHDRLAHTLARGLEGPVHRLRTYPGETYPADQAAVIGAVARHQQTTGTDHGAVLRDFLHRYREVTVDSQTGLLFQSIRADDGRPLDAPRGSGTALAAYFLRDADPALSRALYHALRHTEVLGFAGIREYPSGHGGLGDVDSGPVLFGMSVSATGFGLAGARVHQDRSRFRKLYRTTHLFGAPIGGRFLTGGGLGNAILLAMLTAPASAD